QDMMSKGLQEQAKESRREISFACDAIMYEQYVIFILHRWAHLSGTQQPCTCPPLRYKREALAVHKNSLQTDSSSRELSLSREGNSTHSGRRVLRFGGPNHSKS